MKLMGNPWVVGCLCLIAVAVVGYQFLPARRGAGVPPAAAVSPAPAPPSVTPVRSVPATSALATQSAARATAGTNAIPPITPVDRVYVQSHLAQWLQAPQRDPFLLGTAAKPGAAAAVLVSPVSHWKLNSIWRQTGSRLAIINNDIYAEGDVIEGYRIEQIESGQVWFNGPAGRESLSFGKPQPPSDGSQRINGPNH